MGAQDSLPTAVGTMLASLAASPSKPEFDTISISDSQSSTSEELSLSATFEPEEVPKHQSRTFSIDEKARTGPTDGQTQIVPANITSAGSASEAEQGHSFPPNASGREHQALPPVDGGRQAWTYLVAALLLESIVWGYATSFGVLLDYYLRSPLGAQPGAETILPLVGTANTGSMYCLSPIMAAIVNRYPQSRKPLMYAGTALCFVCLLGASFAKTNLQLLVTQGFGYGIGGVMTYYPAMAYLPEWFVAKRGLANGLIFAGTGAGGLIFPFVLTGLLSRYSLPTTLRALAIFIGLSIGICVYFIHPRIPVGKGVSADRRPRTSFFGDRAVFKSMVIWLFLAATTLQGCAFFLPGLYLPTYARSLPSGTSGSSGPAILAAMNGASIVSRSLMGIASDRYAPHMLGAVTTLVGSVTIFALWGGAGATGLVALVVFALMFGLSAGGWSSIFFAVIKERSDDSAVTVTLYGAISFARGLGNILSGPISSSLLLQKFDAPSGSGFAVDHDTYSSLILFCGLSMGAAGLIEAGLATRATRKVRTQ